MAGLDLNIETGDAAAKMAELAKGIDATAASGEKLPGTVKNVEDLAKATEGVKPIDAGVADSMEKAAAAASKMGDAGQQAGNFGEKLRDLLGQTGEAATMGDVLERGATAALNFGKSLGSAGAATAAGAEAFTVLSAAASGIPAVLLAIGTAIGSINWAAYAEKGLEAAMVTERLQRAINAFSKDAHDAPQALEKLNEIADKTGLSLEKLEKPFGKFASVAEGAGFSAKFAATAFGAIEGAAQKTGATIESTNALLNTFDRWMSQGTMSAGMLSRAMINANIPMTILGAEFQNMGKNAILPQEAFNKLLVAMEKMGAVALTLQEQTQRVANSWHLLAVEFGLGIMDTETNSMKALADAMHDTLPQFEALYRFAGQVYGVLMQLGNYVEAGFIRAFGGALSVIQDTWGIISKLGQALGPVKDVFSDLGSAVMSLGPTFQFLGGEVLNTIKVLTQLGVLIGLGLVESCKLLGEALGILVGYIAGTLYNALAGLINQLAETIPFIKRMRDEWNEGVDAARRVRDASDEAAKAAERVAAADRKAAEDAAKRTLENEKLVRGLKDRLDVEKAIADRAAIIFAGPQEGQNFKQNPNGTWGPNQPGGGGGGGGQQQLGTGPYGGGTSGSYHDFADNAMGQLMSSVLRQAYKDGNADLIDRLNGVPQSWLGGQVGPQAQFGNNGDKTGVNSSPTPVTMVDPQGTPVGTPTNPFGTAPLSADPNPLGATGFGQIPMAQIGGPNTTPADLAAFQKGVDQAAQVLADVTNSQAGAIAGMIGALTTTTTGLDAATGALGGVQSGMGDMVTGLAKDTTATQDNTTRVETNTFQCVENTIAEKFNTSALFTDAAANLTDAASQSGNNSGGGGGPTDQGTTAPNQNNFGNNGTDPNLYLDTGGIIGQWGGRQGPSVPLAAWANAPHFADGGLTGGGIPIIAHPNEAVVPLKGGAIPVDLTGIVSGETTITQAVKDTQQTIINVGTLAHTDFGQLFSELKIINDTLVTMAAFAASAASSAAAASAASSANNALSSSLGVGGGGGSTNSGTGKFMRGFWGTSSNGGYLPQTSTNAYQSGGQFYDANGKLINTGGAADGLESTNALPGMSPRGVPLMVHQDEAVVNLNGGGRIPVDLRGAGAPGASGGNTTVVHQHFHVSVPQDMFGRGPTSDQIAQKVGSVVNDAVRRIGSATQIDDPTVRVNDTRRGGNLI